MNDQILLFAGAALPLIWGIAHLFPARSVISGFGDINPDNRNIIAMEWIIEGIALIFIGVLIIIVTLVDQGSVVSFYVYLITAITLIVLAIVSVFTGFRVNFLPFRLCPLIFTASSTLILIGAMI